MVGGACGDCAKGKYSQITREEGMIAATTDIRGGRGKRVFARKIREMVRCILIFILSGIRYYIG